MKKIAVFISGAVLLPWMAFAANAEVGMVDYNGEKLATLIGRVVSYVLGFSAAIAILFIIWAGLKYVTASGNKDRIESAKKSLTFAIIGLIVIILSFAIVNFVEFNINKINETSSEVETQEENEDRCFKEIGDSDVFVDCDNYDEISEEEAKSCYETIGGTRVYKPCGIN